MLRPQSPTGLPAFAIVYFWRCEMIPFQKSIYFYLLNAFSFPPFPRIVQEHHSPYEASLIIPALRLEFRSCPQVSNPQPNKQHIHAFLQCHLLSPDPFIIRFAILPSIEGSLFGSDTAIAFPLPNPLPSLAPFCSWLPNLLALPGVWWVEAPALEYAASIPFTPAVLPKDDPPKVPWTPLFWVSWSGADIVMKDCMGSYVARRDRCCKSKVIAEGLI